MNRMVMALFLCTLVAGTAAWAQESGTIALSTSPDGTTCSIIDAAPGLITVHVVVLNASQMSAIQFVALKPDCWAGATYQSESHDGVLSIGDTQDPVMGLSVAFGDCLDGTVHVATITYVTTGTESTCCPYEITKASHDLYPEIPGPIVAVCVGQSDMQVAGITADAVVNPDPECACLAPLGVEESTWGRVKSLYQ